jgi:hypothetical protein
MSNSYKRASRGPVGATVVGSDRKADGLEETRERAVHECLTLIPKAAISKASGVGS